MTETSFIPGKSAIRQLENFVDNLYESLFLNDTYYGNLLICLSELNDLLYNNSQEQPVELNYTTDHKTLSISIKGINEDINNRLKTDINHDNNEITLEILKSLSDTLDNNGDYFTMTFDIGALHNSIYYKRVKLLNEYLMKHKTKEVNP